MARKPAFAWSVDLPATEDYQERLQEIAAPKDLKPGFYYLVASHDPNFGEQNNQVSYTPFWVSRLAMVIRSRGGENSLEGFVLDAASGQPIAGAEVLAWSLGDNNQRNALPPVKSDENGLFRIATTENRNHLVLVRHQDQQLATADNYSTYRNDQREQPYQRTFFFTDRSLYRPGQTIQYKGISIRVETEADKYEILAKHDVTVVFQDVNGEEIARQQHRTNDFGSFSGSFTAPRDRLMGRMAIRVDGDAPGETSLNVEEYKRPKFQVTLDAPKTAAKLNAAVSLQGKATAYTGAAIDGANVRWRVVREVRYPVWWYWRMWWLPPQPESSQEIARGTVVTAADGGFAVEFTAKPDLSVPEKDEPTFQYTIYADVTDTAGETRSDERTVNVGYTALQATLSAGDWLTVGKPVEVKIQTTTLDGEGQQAEGSLKIHRLQPPERVQRAQLSGGYVPYMRGGQPVEPAPDLSNPNSWPLGEVVAERGFTTDAAGNVSYSFDLPVGRVSRTGGDAGPFRQAGDRRVAAAGSGSGGQEAGHQGAASVCCAEVVAPAGRGVFGPVGYGVRQGAGVCRNRASPQAGPKLLDRSGGYPGDDQAVGLRSDAGRLHGSRHDGPREPSVSRIPPRRRALDQQGSEAALGAFCLQAAARPEGNVDAGCRAPK